MSLTSIYHTSRRTAILLVLILMLAGFTRILSFSGYFGSDDGVYAELSYQMANGSFEIGEHSHVPVFPLRVGLLAPVALGFKIAGPNELVMIMYPFVLSMLGIILAFLVGRAFFNERAGLIAAAILSILPIDTRSASMLLPDLPAAFWATLGVLLLYYGSNRVSTASKGAYAASSGLAFGLSWLCKASVVYLFPFIAIYMVWLTYRQKRNIILFLSTSLTFISVLMVESLIYYQHTLDLLYRYHEIERNYEVSKIYFFAEGSKFGWAEEGYWFAVVRRILKEGPKAIFLKPNFGLVTGTAMLSIGYAAFRRLRSFLFPGLWFLSLVFIFNFGSSSLQFYRPLVLFGRYLYPLLFPAVILTAGLIDVLMPFRGSMKQEIARERFFWGSAVAMGIVSICLVVVYGNIRAGVQSKVERAISHMLAPSDPIYTDSRTAWVLEFFWKYPKKTRTWDFEDMEINDVPSRVYVLINRKRADFLNSTYGYTLPKFYEDIPNDWLLKWSGNRAELYWVPGK